MPNLPRTKVFQDSFEDGRSLAIDTVEGMVRFTISGGRYQGASFTIEPDETPDIEQALEDKREELRTQEY